MFTTEFFTLLTSWGYYVSLNNLGILTLQTKSLNYITIEVAKLNIYTEKDGTKTIDISTTDDGFFKVTATAVHALVGTSHFIIS